MGLRLPFDQLPWVLEWTHEARVLRGEPARPPAPPAVNDVPDPYERFSPMAADDRPETIIRRHHAWTGVPHTALCVEPRDGKLYVFMPLLNSLSHFAELLAAVEATAAELSIPVLIEGYDPPRDPALRSLKVTPDPGVIEVNIHPAAS